ncbi:unnamed protein product [Rhizophagus irregularis]|nr:unnamed protein product [Rhizophagus irregularis]
MTDNEFIINDSWRPISRKNTGGDLLKRATNVLKHVPDAQIVKYYHHKDVTLKDGDNQDKVVDDTFLSIITNLYHVKGTIYIYIPLYLTSNTTIITSNIERG